MLRPASSGTLPPPDESPSDESPSDEPPPDEAPPDEPPPAEPPPDESAPAESSPAESPPAGPPSPRAMTAPGGAARRAVRCSAAVLGSPGGPTTAISAGPEMIASATARPQPAARGKRVAIGGGTPRAAPAAPPGRAAPVSAA